MNDLREVLQSNPPADRPMNFRPHQPSILHPTPLDLSPRVPAPVPQRFVFIRRCKSKERRWLRSHNREFTVETEFSPKVQAKRAGNSFLWNFLRVGKGEGFPKRSKESFCRPDKIKSTVNIFIRAFMRNIWISYSFKYGDFVCHDWCRFHAKCWFAFECLLRIYFSQWQLKKMQELFVVHRSNERKNRCSLILSSVQPFLVSFISVRTQNSFRKI